MHPSPSWARSPHDDEPPEPSQGPTEASTPLTLPGSLPARRRKAWREWYAELEAMEAAKARGEDIPQSAIDDLRARMAAMDPRDDERHVAQLGRPDCDQGATVRPGALVAGRTVAEWLRYDARAREPAMPFTPGLHFASWRQANRP